MRQPLRIPAKSQSHYCATCRICAWLLNGQPQRREAHGAVTSPNPSSGLHPRCLGHRPNGRTSPRDEVKQQTHLVAQFDSGHTGWIKIALEKDPSTDKAVERLEDPDPSNLARGVLLAAFARPRVA
jgi:hypothetical protein